MVGGALLKSLIYIALWQYKSGFFRFQLAVFSFFKADWWNERRLVGCEVIRARNAHCATVLPAASPAHPLTLRICMWYFRRERGAESGESGGWRVVSASVQ